MITYISNLRQGSFTFYLMQDTLLAYFQLLVFTLITHMPFSYTFLHLPVGHIKYSSLLTSLNREDCQKITACRDRISKHFIVKFHHFPFLFSASTFCLIIKLLSLLIFILYIQAHKQYSSDTSSHLRQASL
jgi:hypothetical protein